MTATPIEWLYACIVVVGVLCNAWCLREAVKDRRVAVSNRECTEMAWIIANANVRAEFVRLSVQVSFLTIAVMALLSPPAVDPTRDPWLMAYVICVRLGFLAATINLVVNSLMNVRERRRILHLNGQPHFPQADTYEPTGTDH